MSKPPFNPSTPPSTITPLSPPLSYAASETTQAADTTQTAFAAPTAVSSMVPGGGWNGATTTPSAVGTSSYVGYDQPVIAQWTVPFKEVVEYGGRFVKDDEYHVGLLAHHFTGISRVDMAIDGGPFVTCPLNINPIDGIEEYIAKVPLSSLGEGLHEVRAIVWPNHGSPMVIQGKGTYGFTNEDRYGLGFDKVKKSHQFFYRPPNSIHNTKNRYVSVNGSDTTGLGTLASPYATIGQALWSLSGSGLESGGKIFMSAGDHYWDMRKIISNTGNTSTIKIINGLPWYGREFPVVIQPYEGVTGVRILDTIQASSGLSGNFITSDGQCMKIHSLEIRDLDFTRTRGMTTAFFAASAPRFTTPSPLQGTGYGESSFVLKGVKARNLTGITTTSPTSTTLRHVYDENSFNSWLMPNVDTTDFYSRLVSHVDTYQDTVNEAKLPSYLARRCQVRNSMTSQIFGTPRCVVGNSFIGFEREIDGVRWYNRPTSTSPSAPNGQHLDIWQFTPLGWRSNLTGGFGGLDATIRGTNTSLTGPNSAKIAWSARKENLEFTPYDYLIGMTAGMSINSQNFGASWNSAQNIFDGDVGVITLTGCGPNNAYSGTYRQSRHSIVFDKNTLLRGGGGGTFILIAPSRGTSNVSYTDPPQSFCNGGICGLWPYRGGGWYQNFLMTSNVMAGGSVKIESDTIYNVSFSSSHNCVLFKNNYDTDPLPATGIGITGFVVNALGDVVRPLTDSTHITGGAPLRLRRFFQSDAGYPGAIFDNQVNFTYHTANTTSLTGFYMPFRSSRTGIWYEHGGWTGEARSNVLEVDIDVVQGDAVIGGTVEVRAIVYDEVLGTVFTASDNLAIRDIDHKSRIWQDSVLESITYQWYRTIQNSDGNYYYEPIPKATNSSYIIDATDIVEGTSDIFCVVSAHNYRDRLDGVPSKSGTSTSVRLKLGGVNIGNPITNAVSANWTTAAGSSNIYDQTVRGQSTRWVATTSNTLVSGSPTASNPGAYRTLTGAVVSTVGGPELFPTWFASPCTGPADARVRPVWFAYTRQTSGEGIENTYGGPLPWMKIVAATGPDVGTAVLYFKGITGPSNNNTRWYEGTANCNFPTTSSTTVPWRVMTFLEQPPF